MGFYESLKRTHGEVLGILEHAAEEFEGVRGSCRGYQGPWRANKGSLRASIPYEVLLIADEILWVLKRF